MYYIYLFIFWFLVTQVTREVRGYGVYCHFQLNYGGHFGGENHRPAASHWHQLTRTSSYFINNSEFFLLLLFTY